MVLSLSEMEPLSERNPDQRIAVMPLIIENPHHRQIPGDFPLLLGDPPLLSFVRVLHNARYTIMPVTSSPDLFIEQPPAPMSESKLMTRGLKILAAGACCALAGCQRPVAIPPNLFPASAAGGWAACGGTRAVLVQP